MTKTDLIFPAFCSTFVDFAVQFSFRCKFSFNEERTRSVARVRFDSGTIFLDQSQFFASIATNEIASFCVDPRSRQMTFFRAKAGQRFEAKAG